MYMPTRRRKSKTHKTTRNNKNTRRTRKRRGGDASNVANETLANGTVTSGTEVINPLYANNQTVLANPSQVIKPSSFARFGSALSSGVSRVSSALSSGVARVGSAFTSELSKNISVAKKKYGDKDYLLKLIISNDKEDNDLACKILINGVEFDKLRSSHTIFHTDPYTVNKLSKLAINFYKLKKNGKDPDCDQFIKDFKTLYKP